MKFILLILLCSSVSFGYAQNFFKEKYDQFFPNNKSIQIQKLTAERDSLNAANDSLKNSLIVSVEKINGLKQEVVNLKAEVFKEQQKSLNSHSELQNEVILLRDSIKRISFPLVLCKEEMITKKGLQDPIIVNTSTWRNYQIIEKGTPDYKGRYSWTTELYRKNGDSLIKVTNAELFKTEKIAELEKMINQRLEEDFKALRISDPECFGRRRHYPNFKLKDMRIAFTTNSEISFEITYGLSDACFAVNTASTNLKIVDLREFFSE